MSQSVYGTIKPPDELSMKIAETIQARHDEYLAEVERVVGLPPRKIPRIKSYSFTDDGNLDKMPEDEIPCVVILTPGVASQPVMDGDGYFRVNYVASVAVIAAGQNQEEASKLAKWYGVMIATLLLQNSGVGGYVDGMTWRGVRFDDLPTEAARSMAIAFNVFEMEVPDVLTMNGGLPEPPDDPYEDQELPTLTRSQATVDAMED